MPPLTCKKCGRVTRMEIWNHELCPRCLLEGSAHSDSSRWRWSVVVVLSIGALLLVTFTAMQLSRSSERERQASHRAEAASQATAFLDQFEAAIQAHDGTTTGQRRSLIDRYLHKAENRFLEEPLARARVLSSLGLKYLGLGDPERAGQVLRTALDLRLDQLPETHPDVAESLVALAVLHRHIGELNRARALIEEALEVRRKFFDEASSEIAECQLELGISLFLAKRPAEAELPLRAAFTAWTELLPVSRKELAQTAGYLLLTLRSLGQNAEAESVIELMSRSGLEFPDLPAQDVNHP